MEIKKRELLIDIIIFCIIISLGFIMEGKVFDSQNDTIEIYQKSLKVKDGETFDYAIESQQGDLFIDTKIKAVDTVKFSEMNKEFMFVVKTREDYVMKQRWVEATKDSKGNVITPGHWETYWEWEVTSRDSVHSQKVIVFDKEFDYNLFEVKAKRRIRASEIIDGAQGVYLKKGSDTRFSYDVIPSEVSGSFPAKAGEKGLTPIDKRKKFDFRERTSQQRITDEENYNRIWTVIYWIIILSLSGLAVCTYTRTSNEYLD